jgi:hypothetical protein
MTLFEYMSVAVSLVLALTIAEGLRGLHSAFLPDRRYGVHVTWLLIKLSNPITFWWSMWGLRDFTEYWNFGTYSLAMLLPAIFYLQISSLVGHTPYAVRDWRRHFYDQRKWFFGMNIILGVLTTMMVSGIFSGLPVNTIPTVGYSLITALSIICFISDNPKTHAYVVSIVASFQLIYFGFATFRPVSL